MEDIKLTLEEKAANEKLEARRAKAKSLGASYEIGIKEDGKVLFLREPDKALYDVYFAILDDKDNRPAKETALKTLTINEVSDIEIFNDYKALLGAFSQLADIMAVKKSTLRKL